MAAWSSSLLSSLALRLLLLLQIILTVHTAPTALFREYIGAEFKNVTFSDVPINPGVDFHFILSFAIDYTSDSNSPSPNNGQFKVFWDTDNLSPTAVRQTQTRHGNVKFALSLGGDSVGNDYVYFTPKSINSWVYNAVYSITRIVKKYGLDGIDIDYEHFKSDPNTFAECIGQLVTILKKNKIISFASIAPYDDDQVQSHYQALWRKYGSVIDYVNFQFYAYDNGTSVSQFLNYFDAQSSNYDGGKVLVSFISDGSKGLSPSGGFFTACRRLEGQGKLHGIFVWCADDSKGNGFPYEKQSQALLASSD